MKRWLIVLHRALEAGALGIVVSLIGAIFVIDFPNLHGLQIITKQSLEMSFAIGGLLFIIGGVRAWWNTRIR